MIRKLFICSTQYQLFNCINISLDSNNEKKDLLIIVLNSTILKDICFESLNRIFDNIYFWDVYKKTRSSVLKARFILKNLLFCSVKGINFNNVYNDVFISGTEIYSKIIAMKLFKSGADIHYFEDGLESYDSILDEKHKYKQDTFFKIIYQKRALDACSDLYVYRPDLVINNSYKIPIKHIKIANYKEQNLDLTTIFSEKCQPFTKKIIFLTTWFQDYRMYGEQIEYIKWIATKFPKNYCLKLHPSDSKSDRLKEYIVENCGNFEIANALFDMSRSIFISIISTACLTPNLIFGRTTTCIFLYKIFMKKFIMPEWNETENVIKKLLKDSPDLHIYIPESMDDLASILEHLLGNNMQKKD